MDLLQMGCKQHGFEFINSQYCKKFAQNHNPNSSIDLEISTIFPKYHNWYIPFPKERYSIIWVEF